MNDLENGMLVQHASLGLGKVVALEPKAVHVFFAARDSRFATKLRLPAALPLLTRPAAGNAWLEGLSTFTYDAKSGRWVLASTWISHPEAVARFVESFPQGFADPKYTGGEKGRRGRASRWRRAHDAFAETLGGGEGERLLAAGDVAGLVERAVAVERHVRALWHDGGPSLEDALAAPEAARGYFGALFDLLAAPEPARASFEALAAAAAALQPGGPRESDWPIVTLFPFVARPDRHMLLRPRLSCEAAKRFGLELAYGAVPNWPTYEALVGTTRLLLERLRPMDARDHVDVESFMFATAAKHPRAKPLLQLVT